MKPLLLTCLAALAIQPVASQEREDKVSVDPAAQQDLKMTDFEGKNLLKSLPNSKGEIVFSGYEHRDGNSSGGELVTALYLVESDGTVIKLSMYGSFGIGAKRFVEPPPHNEILWLGDDYFACVASGRLNSFYTIYKRIGGEPDCVLPWVEGSFHFRVDWHVEDGVLIATDVLKRTVSRFTVQTAS